MAGERGRLAADALLEVAVAADGVDVVVERALALGGVGVEQAALAAGGHRHAHGVGDALAERAGRGLDAGGVAVLGVARGLGAPGPQALQVVELEAEATEEELGVEGDARVPAGQHEPVATGPRRVGGGVPHLLLEQQVGQRGQAHRRAGVAVAHLLHRVHREDAAGVHRPLVEFGPVQLGHGVPFRVCDRPSDWRGRLAVSLVTRGDRLRAASDAPHPRFPVTHVGQSASAVEQPEPTRATFGDVVAAYVGLTKPRVIELLLLTTVPVMFFAARGIPELGLVVATVVGGTLSAGLRLRPQLRLRPRHRRADAAYPQTGTSTPHRLAAFGPGLRPAAGRGLDRGAGALGQLALGGAGGARQRVLRARLHDGAQAPDHPEHRLGRAGRLLPGADRLDRRHQRAVLGAGRALRRGLLLDAAPHLGAGAALPRGLRQRRRPDAAGGGTGAGGRAPDRALQLGDGRHVPAAVAGGRTPGSSTRSRPPSWARCSWSRPTGCGAGPAAPRTSA